MPRHADHAIQPQFIARHSPRAFADTSLTAAQMMSVLEAARWAPSASNNQPWRAVWGLRGDDSFAAIAAALVDSNRLWAAKAGGLIAWASAGVVTRDGVDKPNAWAAFDAGTAWGYLALQAHAMGLITHAMGGFDAPALSSALDMPASYTLHAVIAVGHPGDAADLPENLRAREVPSPRNGVQAWAGQGRFV